GFRPMFQVLAVVAILCCNCSSLRALDVNLESSITTPVPIGTPMRFTALGDDMEEGGTTWYRFRIRPPGGEFRMIRDFAPDEVLDWISTGREGTYELEVTARDALTGETTAIISELYLQSATDGTRGAVNTTPHPLVFLYSAPPCEAGSQIR